jgi:hypothetical protein
MSKRFGRNKKRKLMAMAKRAVGLKLALDEVTRRLRAAELIHFEVHPGPTYYLDRYEANKWEFGFQVNTGLLENSAALEHVIREVQERVRTSLTEYANQQTKRMKANGTEPEKTATEEE